MAEPKTIKIRNKETGEIVTLREKSQPSQSTPQPDVKGVFGNVPADAYAQGERNWAGNVFERPAAASRAAIQQSPSMAGAGPLAGLLALSGLSGSDAQQAATKGAANPGSIPTFNKLAQESGGTSTGLNFAKNISGVAADIATSPADMAGLLIGKTPTPWGELGEVAGRAVAKSGKAMASAMKWESTLKQANKADAALEGLKDTFGKAKQIAIQPVENAPTSFDFASHKYTPDVVFNKLKAPEHGIEFQADGNIKQTVGNLDKVRQMLGDLNKTKWEGKTDAAGRAISRLYGEVRNEMVKASEKYATGAGKSLSESLDAFSGFMDHYKLVKPVISAKGDLARANGLKALFKPGAEDAVKDAFREVSKLSPDLKQVMGVAKRNDILKGLAKLVYHSPITKGAGFAIGGGAGYAAYKALKD